MLKRILVLAVLAAGLAVFAQTAAADPVHAKNASVFTASCNSGPDIRVAVNGNGEFTAAHVVGSTAVFIPQAFHLTFSFTPAGSTQAQIETDNSAKKHQHGHLVTCTLDAAKNTFTSPEGTFSLSGQVTGFFTPAH